MPVSKVTGLWPQFSVWLLTDCMIAWIKWLHVVFQAMNGSPLFDIHDSGGIIYVNKAYDN